MPRQRIFYKKSSKNSFDNRINIHKDTVFSTETIQEYEWRIAERI